jgi:uncharacterized protein (DUF58 family)
MIKSSLAVKVIPILSLALYLTVPYKLVQIICFAVLLTELLCFLYALILSKKIQIERNLTTMRLHSGEQAEITFSIINYSRLPVFVCYVYDDISFIYVYDNGNRKLILLRPKEIKKISYRIHVQQRGEFYAGPVNLKFSDPLNLFSVSKEIDSKMKIFVRPAKITLTADPLPGLPQGNISIKNICYEDVTMRRSLREYRSGDELKRINWRASAKYGSLFTNEYQDTFDVPFFVFVNLAEEDYRFDRRPLLIERALELAAHIVERAAVLRQRCGFAAYGTGFPYLKPANNQIELILDIISTIGTEKGKLDYNPEEKFKSQLPFGTQLFVIGPKEVDFYNDKAAAERTDMSTENLGITRSIWK